MPFSPLSQAALSATHWAMARLAPILLALAPLVAACDDALVRWVDPEVVRSDIAGGERGPSTLVVGFGQGDAFVSLAERPVQEVVAGLQGGTWTMPTLRADTLAAALAIECRLQTASELLGETRVTTPTRPAAPGWVEVARLPIPVTHAPPHSHLAIDDLAGAPATLSCAASAAGSSASVEYAVTLDVP
jgi:hypothetical protein